MPVFRKKKGHKLGMDCFVAAEVSAKETAYKLTVDRCIISGEMYVFDCAEEAFKIVLRQSWDMVSQFFSYVESVTGKICQDISMFFKFFSFF